MIIKANDILAAANAKVAEYLADGYMISFGDSSFGCKFRVDLEKNGRHVRVKVDDKYGYGEQALQMALTVVEIPAAEGFEPKDVAPLFTKVWYCINEYQRDKRIYTESLEEIQEIVSRRAERNHRRLRKFGGKSQPGLTVTASFIRSLKRRKGFSNATRNNIMVQRVSDGYAVYFTTRAGHISRVEVIKFPG